MLRPLVWWAAYSCFKYSGACLLNLLGLACLSIWLHLCDQFVFVHLLIVVASGLWVSPGDSEEVATALSQALKNRLERFGCCTYRLLSFNFVCRTLCFCVNVINSWFSFCPRLFTSSLFQRTYGALVCKIWRCVFKILSFLTKRTALQVSNR